MAGTGRATKLTPAIHEAIVQAVTVGLPLIEAAALAGVAKSTVLQWLQRGEGRARRGIQARYVDFVDAITRARAVDEARRIARIEQAGRGGTVVSERTTRHNDGREVTERTYALPDWRADAFHLERAYPERWGRRARLAMDLTRRVRQVAQQVADELGIEVETLLAEAQQVLRDHDQGRF
jgi:hypothetical protein